VILQSMNTSVVVISRDRIRTRRIDPQAQIPHQLRKPFLMVGFDSPNNHLWVLEPVMINIARLVFA
jgi:hypothetical protein